VVMVSNQLVLGHPGMSIWVSVCGLVLKVVPALMWIAVYRG